MENVQLITIITLFSPQWNISDYLYHNREKLVMALANDTAVCPEVPNHAELPPLDKLWMCLYIRLSEYLPRYQQHSLGGGTREEHTNFTPPSPGAATEELSPGVRTSRATPGHLQRGVRT